MPFGIWTLVSLMMQKIVLPLVLAFVVGGMFGFSARAHQTNVQLDDIAENSQARFVTVSSNPGLGGGGGSCGS